MYSLIELIIKLFKLLLSSLANKAIFSLSFFSIVNDTLSFLLLSIATIAPLYNLFSIFIISQKQAFYYTFKLFEIKQLKKVLKLLESDVTLMYNKIKLENKNYFERR